MARLDTKHTMFVEDRTVCPNVLSPPNLTSGPLTEPLDAARRSTGRITGRRVSSDTGGGDGTCACRDKIGRWIMCRGCSRFVNDTRRLANSGVCSLVGAVGLSPPGPRNGLAGEEGRKGVAGVRDALSLSQSSWLINPSETRGCGVSSPCSRSGSSSESSKRLPPSSVVSVTSGDDAMVASATRS